MSAFNTYFIIFRDLSTLNGEDWEEIKQATQILEIFNEVTIAISSEKSVSISKILYFIKVMTAQVSLEKYPDNILKPRCKLLLDEIRKQLKSRFDTFEDSELITQGTFLDPRFKKLGFINLAKYEKTVEMLKLNILTAVPSEITESVGVPAEQENPSCERQSSLLWEEFDRQAKECNVMNPRAAAIIEVDRYIREPQLDRNEDPLKWWDERHVLYPNLYEVVKRRLCIVATSVPCERLFSKTGQVLTERRNRLGSKKLSQVMFLNCNLELE